MSIKQENDHILIEIKDNGRGIPDDEIKEVFKSFSRAHEENMEIE